MKRDAEEEILPVTNVKKPCLELPPAKRSVIFVRHFEQSAHRTDPPLKKDVVVAPTGAADWSGGCDRVYCSPYRRCRETAEKICNYYGTARSLKVDVRLSEFHGGKKLNGKFQLDSSTVYYSDKIPGASETWPQCAARLDAFLAELRHMPAPEQAETLLVVTHGVAVRYAQEQLIGHTEWSRGRDVPYGGGFTVCL